MVEVFGVMLSRHPSSRDPELFQFDVWVVRCKPNQPVLTPVEQSKLVRPVATVDEGDQQGLYLWQAFAMRLAQAWTWLAIAADSTGLLIHDPWRHLAAAARANGSSYLADLLVASFDVGAGATDGSADDQTDLFDLSRPAPRVASAIII